MATDKALNLRIAALPQGVPTRLIDNCSLHLAASAAGHAERYRRAETSHTIHVWWARRPQTTMRALVFACLCRPRTAAAQKVLSELCGPNPSEASLDQARQLLGSDSPPRLLDMFGGGGTIPEQAALLGAQTDALDQNELSVFIQRCLLQYPKGIKPRLAARLLSATGKRVLECLAADTAPFFPHRGRFCSYLWSNSRACVGCGYRFFLSKRLWLSKKKGLALSLGEQSERQSQQITKVAPNFKPASAWKGRAGLAICPRCGHQHPHPSIDQCRDELMAVMAKNGHQGKSYAPAPTEDPKLSTRLAALEKEILTECGLDIPQSLLPVWSGIVNPALYGMKSHGDLFNPRQRVVLLSLIRALRREHEGLAKSEGAPVAKYITALLSGLIDQVVDWNCRLSMWIPQNEQVGRAFCGPGVAMLWDYAETDPVGDGPSNLWRKLDRIGAGLAAASKLEVPVTVRKGSAQTLPYPDASFDAVVTDPPYYDNIFYSVLSDFFYSWKRLLFADIEPDLFSQPATDWQAELVASRFRARSDRDAHEGYTRQLGQAIGETARVLKPDGVFALIYSHRSLLGWEALVRAYRPHDLRITSVLPLRVERNQRPRAVRSQAINTCVAWIARRTVSPKKRMTLKALDKQFETLCSTLAAELARENWPEGDIGIALFAQAAGLLANCAQSPNGSTDLEALRFFADRVRTRIPSFRLRDPLGG